MGGCGVAPTGLEHILRQNPGLTPWAKSYVALRAGAKPAPANYQLCAHRYSWNRTLAMPAPRERKGWFGREIVKGQTQHTGGGGA